MSDLAPFVAATLRDKVLSELLEEVQALREEKHALEYVEITGPNREPVYARGHLRDDGREASVHVGVDMDAEQLPCPLEGIKDVEIWVRNVKAKTASFGAGIGFDPDSETAINFGSEYAILANFDFSQEERQNIKASAAEAHARSDVAFSLRTETFRVVTEEVPQTDPTKSCTFTRVYVHRDAIEL